MVFLKHRERHSIPGRARLKQNVPFQGQISLIGLVFGNSDR